MKITWVIVTFVITIVVILSAASTINTVSNTVLAQNNSNSSSLTKLTDGGSITIKLEPSSNPIKSSEQTQLKISFFKPNTEEIQPHIDYDMIISEANTNKTIFQAQTGQAGIPLHTAESIVTIPFTFPTKGEYAIKIPVFGILFNPIAPESVTYKTYVE